MKRFFGHILVSPWEPKAKTFVFTETPFFMAHNCGQDASLPNFRAFTRFRQGSDTWTAGVTGQGQRELQSDHVVHKPWGAEFWLSGENNDFCLKRIQIKQGHRTSLQYHREKEETNVLVSGKLRLHYYDEKVSGKIELSRVRTVDLEAPVYLHIKPFTLHRMEAITDLDFFETSTAQVDDVVRVADETKRPDGRIESEHKK